MRPKLEPFPAPIGKLLGFTIVCDESPNAAERPRMRLAFLYERSDLLHEVADAFGRR